MPFTFFDKALARQEWEGDGPIFTEKSTTWDVVRHPVWYPEEFLKRSHTKMLMVYLGQCHAYNQNTTCVAGDHRNSVHWVTLDQVKAELAKREHVRNKKEGKAWRRALSQGKHHLLRR